MSRSEHPVRRARRQAGRKARRAERSGRLPQPPWRQLKLQLPPAEVLRPEQLEAIHHASLTILEEQGMVFLLDEARAILARAGVHVSQGEPRVKLDRHFVLDAISRAPESFTLHARNPAHNLTMGGRHLNVCSVASAPNASDLDGGRRSGNRRDFQNFIRLGQSLNIVHLFGGYPVEPIDLDPATRHLDAIYDLATLSDKVFTIYSLGEARNRDALEMIRLARGLSHEALDEQPSLVTIINTNSPLVLDEPMLTGIIEMARRNQVVVVTPFTLAGAMAPVTLAGALAQQNAEALAGIAFAQTVRPGAPVVYGGFTSNVDMKSGSPAFGTPEYMLAAQAGGQLARHYRLPYRSSNVNAANSLDAQSAYESVFALWGAVMGQTNMLMHGAGWMEGGLCASFEKMVLDADLLQMVATYLEQFDVDDSTLALEAIADVGPGGHFFGTPHTQARYESAFYSPLISDWRNFETWQEAGEPTAPQKANAIYRQLLADYTPPPIDEAVDEALKDYCARQKSKPSA
ncbi:MAG: trimethylamine methyltransferase family protein [Pseudomonadota bacterium]